MAYILRRVLVDDVEETKRLLAETAGERRARGVARESYFTDARRPNQLVVAFDGHDVEQLCAALHPPRDAPPGERAPGPTSGEPSGDLLARLQHAVDALAALDPRLRQRLLQTTLASQGVAAVDGL